MATPERHLRIYDEGRADFPPVDPDGHRDAIGAKSRAMTPKLVSAKEAIERFVADGDYIVWECNYLQRGPSALIREIIRQQKTAALGLRQVHLGRRRAARRSRLRRRADMGFFMGGPGLNRADPRGAADDLRVQQRGDDESPARRRDGTVVRADPLARRHDEVRAFRREADRGSVHRPADGDRAGAEPRRRDHPRAPGRRLRQRADLRRRDHRRRSRRSPRRRSCVSAEEIIDTEDVRHNPGLTKIPYYAVDAVVHQPFGAYPGECPGHYASDTAHVGEVFTAMHADKLGAYLDKWVHSFATEEDMLAKRVGRERLVALERRSTRKEGFRP